VRSGADVKAVVDSGLRLRAEAAELAWPVKWRLQWRALGMGLDEDPGEDWRACEPGPMVRLGVVWDKQALAELGRDAQEALAGDGYRQPSASLTGAAGGGAEQGAVGLSIYECLDLFSQEEQLSASDAWYCPGCNTHKEAFKKFQVWSLAPVLVVHLKRFSQAEASYWVDKDDAFVDYPLEGLDLTSRVAGRAPGACARLPSALERALTLFGAGASRRDVCVRLGGRVAPLRGPGGRALYRHGAQRAGRQVVRV
jgi:hypothetical protein